MVKVQLTANLQKYFPRAQFEIDAQTILDLLNKMDQERAQFSSYIVGEDNAVRKHVNIFVDNELLPKNETHRQLKSGSTVHIMQALSGG